MKTALVISSLALSALAQQANIVTPAAGSALTGGSVVTIAVHQDAAATDDVQVAAILGFRSCGSGGCSGIDPSQDGVGDIIFAGAFNPQRDPTQPQKGLFQDFSWSVPDDLPGPGLLSLVHLQAVGAVKIPELSVSSIEVNIA
ncbi:hypothetical protein BN946_scf185002.g19 [Trametes cinnabarina]|uniref:Uncharacterized protein n=1 Tax=Pycnoporus cinnabarinus TaxID=5643 RepID=A0A060SKW1_PYCCI|nr:hypothetical protein BN946_scf185002.g19 [Trametes cinnabarina]